MMKMIKKKERRENYSLPTILFSLIVLSVLSYADFSRDDTSSIVTDNSSTLQWSDNLVGDTMTWRAAIVFCEDMTLGAYADWRLPNFNELHSILDRSKADRPVIDSTFQFVGHHYYWSSTTFVGNPSSVAALVVNFHDGKDGGSHKSYNHYVRCVRAGQ